MHFNHVHVSTHARGVNNKMPFTWIRYQKRAEIVEIYLQEAMWRIAHRRLVRTPNMTFA